MADRQWRDWKGDYRTMPLPVDPGTLVASYHAGAIEVYKAKGRDLYAVVYGLQINERLTYGDACRKLGQACLHYLQCEGRLDQ